MSTTHGQLSWRADDGSHRFAAFNLRGGGGEREKDRGKECETRQEPQLLSADSRLGPLNHLLDQMCQNQINIHGADSRS